MLFDLRIEAASARQLPSPFNNGPASPIIWRSAQDTALSANQMLGLKIVERTVDVAEAGSSLIAIEGGRDIRVLAGIQVPRTRDDHLSARLQQKPHGRVVLDVVRACDLRLGVKPAADSSDFGKTQGPEREVDKVGAEIHQTPAACKLAVVKPCLVGAIGVVERQVGSEHTTDFVALDQGADFLHPAGLAVGK